ncbi:MAG TPA: hypothetical protein VEA78_04380, partial [Acidimicrobiales bacterium]|nr:hypothetical protein [Acidimicrobiales bacterium]
RGRPVTDERFVLLGLARPRAAWFAEVSRWATSASIAADFVKCLSAEELTARLASGRRWSAVLVDGSLPAVDRDLLAIVRDSGCATVVVDDRDAHRWMSLGASAVLPAAFDRGGLLEALAGVAVAVRAPTALPDVDDERADADALVVTVVGPGGTGTSTLAIALAEGIAASGRDTVLADLARHAEQSVLHDVRDVVPGVQELVEAHRNGVPTADDVRNLTFSIVERGYSLLLGLRRGRYWPSLRPRAFRSAFASLATAFDAVVCDVTGDLETDDAAGSADVGERNLAAIEAARASDVVVVVGQPGVKGVHALVRLIGDVVAAGVPAGRVVPVVNGAPRSPRTRSDVASAVAELAGPALGGGRLHDVVFVPGVRHVDAALRDGTRLPAALVKVTSTVLAAAQRVGPAMRDDLEPVAVVPGSLGSFTELES